MNRRLNNDNQEAVVELGEAELAIVHGGIASLPWLPPSFPIRNPLPKPVDVYPIPARPDAGPRPSPISRDALSLGAIPDLSAILQTGVFDM